MTTPPTRLLRKLGGTLPPIPGQRACQLPASVVLEERTGTVRTRLQDVAGTAQLAGWIQERAAERPRQTPRPPAGSTGEKVRHPTPDRQQPAQLQRGDPPDTDPTGKRVGGDHRLHQHPKHPIGDGRSLPWGDIPAPGNILPGGVLGTGAETRKPFIRTRQLARTGRHTKPILRRTATILRDPTSVISRREMVRGHVSELRIVAGEGQQHRDRQRRRGRVRTIWCKRRG